MIFNALAVLATSFAALSSAAVIPRQTNVTNDSGYYFLHAYVKSGNASFGGMWAQGFHTGAGLSATVLTAEQTDGIVGFLSSDYQYFQESLPFSWFLETNVTSEGPAGYNYLAINAGQGTPGFSLNGTGSNLLTFKGLPNFASFAACWVPGIAPYESVGPEVQVFWRPTETVANPACADIDFYAYPANAGKS